MTAAPVFLRLAELGWIVSPRPAVSLLVVLLLLVSAARAQQPPGPPQAPGAPAPRQQQSGPLPTQGQFARALAEKLGLGFGLPEGQAIAVLTKSGIVPEVGWSQTAPATEVWVAYLQKAFLDRMADLSRTIGAAVPPTLTLKIRTPGAMGGQSFVRPQLSGTGPAGPPPSGGAEKLQVGDTAPVTIETPHPYPIGDPSLPVVWSYRLRRPGVTFIKLHFSRLELQPPDELIVADRFGRPVWRYTGQTAATDVWADAVDGDTAVLLLLADGEGSSWGAQVDKYGYGFPDAPKR